MSVVCERECKQVVESSLEKGMTYKSYIELVNDLAKSNGTTGVDQSEDRVVYTGLNQRRMKRWNKTLKVSEKVRESIEKLDKKYTWLVLTESWCGDAAHVLPAINKVAELSENLDLKVLLRDENPDLMSNFLTNGAQSIPKLVMVDNESGQVVDTYGSRPKVLTDMVKEYKELHGKLTPEFKEDIQVWYNKDKGQTIINELVDLVKE
ncbi:thioredoxin family protein [Urechidicola vernalis]|uniref:Thioredoxin family protein n=1 Tax=Urechidicola vernalis TaxID=3075600 RepID=A0ABU2Y4I6_9FLAO|nr:thioredoxin family protein [Urechidicola sp. P050]MDT0552731.1 thioredoxin family protein [Urechidicola sp. P050]